MVPKELSILLNRYLFLFQGRQCKNDEKEDYLYLNSLVPMPEKFIQRSQKKNIKLSGQIRIFNSWKIVGYIVQYIKQTGKKSILFVIFSKINVSFKIMNLVS